MNFKVIDGEFSVQKTPEYKNLLEKLANASGYICITKMDDTYKLHCAGLSDAELIHQLELAKLYFLEQDKLVYD